MNLVYGLLVGVVMGALIQRVGASSPKMILAALRLEDLTIIKFMATTIAVGALVSYLMNLGLPMHFDIKPTYVIGVAVGGLIFGAGFAIGGYCPVNRNHFLLHKTIRAHSSKNMFNFVNGLLLVFFVRHSNKF